MEKRLKLNCLALIMKKNLLRSFLNWKLALPLISALKKYKKLKQYTSKILKTRHIPNIKIQKSENKRYDSTGKFSTQHTELFRTKTGGFSRINICRSNSGCRSQKSRPPSGRYQEKTQDHMTESEYETFKFQNPLKKAPKPIRPIKNIKSNSSRDTEEIAIVSSNSLLGEIKLQSYYKDIDS